jgi:hypothetical protein
MKICREEEEEEEEEKRCIGPISIRPVLKLPKYETLY